MDKKIIPRIKRFSDKAVLLNVYYDSDSEIHQLRVIVNKRGSHEIVTSKHSV